MSMKYNASGNYDPTAYSGIMNAAKPGEIWTTSQGNEVLILKNHGTLCSMLKLLENQPYHDDDCIEVVSRQLRFTNPCMVAYIFNQGLCQYVKSIPETQYTEIMQTVADRLNVTIRVSKEDVPDAKVEALQERCDALCEAMERMQAEHDDEVSRLNANLRYNEESIDKMVATIQNRDKTIAELKAAGDPVGTVYKQLYHELLDRIIAGGGTK